MSSIIGFFAALLIPPAFGGALIRRFWPQSGPGGAALTLGLGYFLGLFLTTQLMLLWNGLGLPQHFWSQAALLSVAATILVATTRREKQAAHSPEDGSPGQRVILVAALAFVGVRFVSLARETLTLPPFAWDSWMNWAPKARVWFELDHLVPFVDGGSWLESMGGAGYTIGAWAYPPMVPLIQTWTVSGLGQWDDTLMAAPWLLCLLALGLVLYGLLRRQGLSRGAGAIFTYMLLSLPVVDTHVALAGYADLWLSGCYLAAVGLLLNWLREHERRDLALLALFSAACIQLKEPGLAWVLALVPALIAGMVRGRHLALLIALLATGGTLLLATDGFRLDVPGIGPLVLTPQLVSIAKFSAAVQYHPVAEPLAANLLQLPNWHLLFYLLPGALIALAVRALRERDARAMLALVGTAAVFLGGVFFFSDRYVWVADYTIVNRALLHVVPVLVLLIGIEWHRFAASLAAPAPDAASGRVSHA